MTDHSKQSPIREKTLKDPLQGALWAKAKTITEVAGIEKEIFWTYAKKYGSGISIPAEHINEYEKEKAEKWVLLSNAEAEIQKEVEKATEEISKAIHEDWNRAGKEWRKEETTLKAEIIEERKESFKAQVELQNKKEEIQQLKKEKHELEQIANDYFMDRKFWEIAYEDDIKPLQKQIEATKTIANEIVEGVKLSEPICKACALSWSKHLTEVLGGKTTK